MNWIDRIKNEIKEKAAAREFAESHLKPTFERFLNLAHQEADTINADFFEGQPVYKVDNYPQSDKLLFDVMIDLSPIAAMRVTFSPFYNGEWHWSPKMLSTMQRYESLIPTIHTQEDSIKKLKEEKSQSEAGSLWDEA